MDATFVYNAKVAFACQVETPVGWQRQVRWIFIGDVSSSAYAFERSRLSRFNDAHLSPQIIRPVNYKEFGLPDTNSAYLLPRYLDVGVSATFTSLMSG